MIAKPKEVCMSVLFIVSIYITISLSVCLIVFGVIGKEKQCIRVNNDCHSLYNTITLICGIVCFNLEIVNFIVYAPARRLL